MLRLESYYFRGGFSHDSNTATDEIVTSTHQQYLYIFLFNDRYMKSGCVESSFRTHKFTSATSRIFLSVILRRENYRFQSLKITLRQRFLFYAIKTEANLFVTLKGRILSNDSYLCSGVDYKEAYF